MTNREKITAICEKWALKLGPAFNPIEKPRMIPGDAQEYRDDMEELWKLTIDPFGHAAHAIHALYPAQCFHFCYASLCD